MPTLIALLDASVLYQAPVRDLLLQLAFKNVYKARWTDQIHEEWISNLLKNRPDISRNTLENTKKHMNARILDSSVKNFENRTTDLVFGGPD